MKNLFRKSAVGFCSIIGIVSMALLIWYWRSDDATSVRKAPKSLVEKMKRRVFRLEVSPSATSLSNRNEVRTGTCFAIEPSGQFLTAAHVIASRTEKRNTNDPMKISIDHQSHEARLIDIDFDLDLALLELVDPTAKKLLQTIPFSGEKTKRKQSVFLFGFPSKFSGHSSLAEMTVSSGLVSDPSNDSSSTKQSLIRVDGTTHFGGSGSAMVNDLGELVGIVVSAIFDREKSFSAQALAVPSSVIKRWLASSRSRKQEVERSMIDPDGDGIAGASDSDPWIANLPDVRITAENEIRFQLQTEKVWLLEKTKISAREHSEKTAESHKKSRTFVIDHKTSFGMENRGRLSFDPRSLFGGKLEVSRSSKISFQNKLANTFRFEKEELNRVLRNLKESTKEIEKIGSNPWTIIVPIRVTNHSATPCLLRDFDVNIRINGRIQWTKSASEADSAFRGWLLNSSQPSERVLRFSRLSRSEVETLIEQTASAVISVEIPTASLQLSSIRGSTSGGSSTRGSSVPYPWESVNRKCAVVDLQVRRSRRFHVSAITQNLRKGLSLEKFLSRAFTPGAVRWGRGPTGDYLASLENQVGVDVLTPHRQEKGSWIVSLLRVRNQQFPAMEILEGDLRNTIVHPGDTLQISFLGGEEYWKDAKRWKGYVKVYRELLQLAELEQGFWDSLDSYSQLDAESKHLISRDAGNLQVAYGKFLQKYGDDLFVKTHFPNISETRKQFQAWFPGNNEINFPAFRLKLQSVYVRWNSKKDLNPMYLLSCGGGPKQEHSQFTSDGAGGGGEIKPEREIEFSWTPFDRVEVRLKDDGFLQNRDLMAVIGEGYLSAEVLAAEHYIGKLEEGSVEGIDPNLSPVQAFFQIRKNDRWESLVFRNGEGFRELLLKQEPRVIAIVPSSKWDPHILALHLWLDYTPQAHYQCAEIFEQLYRSSVSKEQKVRFLCRALESSFNAFDFPQCLELEKLLPSELDETAIVLPPEKDIRYFHKLAEVSSVARKLTEESLEYRLLVKTIQDWHRFQFWRDRSETEELGKKNRAFLARRAETLRSRVRNHRRELSQVQSKLIRGFLEQRFETMERRLTGQ